MAENKKLYVGNVPYNLDNEGLKQAFEEHGKVVSAQIIVDRETGRSKGFGFVEMATHGDADAAIKALNGAVFAGRPLTVNEARPQVDRPKW